MNKQVDDDGAVCCVGRLMSTGIGQLERKERDIRLNFGEALPRPSSIKTTVRPEGGRVKKKKENLLL